jgi:protein tyrosine kinase modulator
MTIHQFYSILKARKWIVLLVLLLVMSATVAVSALLPTRWTATTSVLVDAKGPDPVTGIVIPALMLPGYMATQVDVIQSRNVAFKVVDNLKLDQDQTALQQWRESTEGRGSFKVWLAEVLLKKLDVKPSRDSSVVEISFSGPDPQRAAAVANAFARAYIETNLELKVEAARHTARWFGDRTLALRRDVERSSARLAEYQQEKGIVSLDEHLDTENVRLEQLNAQLSAAAAQTADALTRQHLARDSLARGAAADAIPEVLSNPLIQILKGEISRKEAKLKELSVKLGPNHPQYQAAAADLLSSRQKLTAETVDVVSGIANNARIAQRREAELQAKATAQKTRVLSLKKQRDELSALMREAENAQKAFDMTAQRYTQTNLESQATQTNIAVLSPAVEPTRPSFPNWPLNIAFSIFVGTMLGVGIALLLEMLDQRLRSEADIPRMLELPVFGTLPQLQVRRELGRTRLLPYRPTSPAQG